MYKLYTDKIENFECKLQLEGASLNKAFSRIILETNDINLSFDGKIDEVIIWNDTLSLREIEAIKNNPLNINLNENSAYPFSSVCSKAYTANTRLFSSASCACGSWTL